MWRYPWKSQFRWPFGRIPIHEAARIAYETVERTGLESPVGTLGISGPEKQITHFKYALLSHDIPHRGKRPPSTEPIPIPEGEFARLRPADGGSELLDVSGSALQYSEVTISRSDLRRFVKKYIAGLRRYREMKFRVDL